MIDMVQEQHASAAVDAEDAAWAPNRHRWGRSFKTGYRKAWWAALTWLIQTHRSHHADLMWETAATGVFVNVLLVGAARTITECDLAVQSAREALHADTGRWYDPNGTGWEALESHVYRFLDLTPTELEQLA